VAALIRLLEHPSPGLRLAGLMTDVSNQQLSREADDRAHRDRQQRRPVLTIRVVRRSDDHNRGQIEGCQSANHRDHLRAPVGVQRGVEDGHHGQGPGS
jgi:hypothetical protein